MKQFKNIIIYEEDAVSLGKDQIDQLMPKIRKEAIKQWNDIITDSEGEAMKTHHKEMWAKGFIYDRDKYTKTSKLYFPNTHKLGLPLNIKWHKKEQQNEK